ncbi:hypothetical protein [Micromonospora sp. NPDC051141]|uniref:hypothetical protein n=1 Tax=Micromonospora sp. NPDC051141 TaxID=3364284 RepID=UPI0037B062DE
MQEARKRAIAAAAITAAMAVPMLVSATPASAHATCGFNVYDRDSSVPVRSTRTNVNVRTGSSTGCPVKTVIYAGDLLDFHCWTLGNDGYTWTFLEVKGQQGWVRDDLLPGNGSNVSCAS